MRVLIVCEKLADRDDEGVKNVARHLLECLAADHEVRALSREVWASREEVISVPMGRFFLDPPLIRAARDFRPDMTIYVPWTSGTPPTFVRAKILEWITGSPVGLVLCQPYPLPPWLNPLLRFFLPALICGMSDGVVNEISRMGGRAMFLPAGVDLGRFSVPSEEQRQAERGQLGIDPDEHVVLHVGHLNRRRLNSDEILMLAKRPGRRVIIVCSPATPQDEGLREIFESAGVQIISEFLPQIERIYWVADTYLFPTREMRNCIGVPLSVLEALASGLSVVATAFEGLPRLFPDSPHVRFVSTSGEMDEGLALMPPPASENARGEVSSLDWKDIADSLMCALSETRASRSRNL